MDTHSKVRQFIEKNLVTFEDEVELNDDDNIFELGYVNSLFAMNILTYIENEFSIEIKNEDIKLENFNTVNNIVALVKIKQQGSVV
ncbi:acyl carrier protein [Brevibacillus laterosporus]|uniref:Acyl carrier protein n=1 Tax=Brevibacillus laterosporus TaxID=1465 RepID=A0A0F7EJF3_BRELA|nr:phosphopantetheine-binding protein [Brevibacillus laterosporus]AKF95954.1 acyl carrier protein [Brevibacillus laterosporus]